jgi:LacI family transcriptional regulator
MDTFWSIPFLIEEMKLPNEMNEAPHTPKKHVAVFCPFSGIGEKILVGIADCFRQHLHWSFHAIQTNHGVVEEDFVESDYAAAILLDMGERMPAKVETMRLPTLRIFDRKEGCTQPVVAFDHDEIGRSAAQHLLGRGFQNFAFVGGIEAPFARRRYLSFRRLIEENRGVLHLFTESFPPRGVGDALAGRVAGFRERMRQWLAALPKPIAVFALDDWKAFETLSACRKLGIRVPEDVAILGVNDDGLACHISIPNLSSIRLPLEKAGFEAALSVMELVEKGKTQDKQFKSVGLVTRASTNSFAVSDRVVEAALKFMQRESSRPIRVEEVLQHVGVSRSLLERRFRGEIGRTPLVEMRRQRVERARALLADTDFAINKIAQMCGFSSNIRFTTVFREQVGITPTEFRAQMSKVTKSD